MNEIPPQTETQLIQQIWKILNEFRMYHFFTKPKDMIDVGDFDEMMELIQGEFLKFENKKQLSKRI